LIGRKARVSLPWDELQAPGTNAVMTGTEMKAGTTPGSWLRRAGEAAFFVVLVAILWTADTLTKFSQLRFMGYEPDTFRLVTEQATSALVVLLLVPAVAWWLTRFPLRRDRAVSALVGHVVGSVLFAVAHYFLMVAMRYVVFLFVSDSYVFSDFWFRNLVIEYQKDIKVYLGIVAIISTYRYYNATRTGAPTATVASDRIIVQTGKGETIIRRDDIEYLEAARNYVTVSTAERDFLVRNTLGRLEQQLAPGRIVRTHRSYLVNIDKIEEIRTTDSGGREIRLQSGKTVPLSRGYRDSFRSLFKE
jgi:DNA-binding LytR/AlgR family response regulator